MATRNVKRIAFIGFGEVGQRFARDFRQLDGVELIAYDIVLDDPARRGERLAKAEALGVMAATSAAAACQGASVVIAAVTADQTEIVAGHVAEFLMPGQYYLDVNSAAPLTKQRAAALVERSGAAYVECAVLAAVAKPGIEVPILTGGPAAEAAAQMMNALGMKMTPASHTYGRASAIKLCRSIVMKGLEAIMVDCAKATHHFGVESEVFASLDATYPAIGWAALSESCAERVATHGVRRAAEMREAADMLRDAGFDGELAAAIADAQQRGAAAKPTR